MWTRGVLAAAGLPLPAAFEGVEKLVELNLQVARAALEEAADNTRAALSVKDAQELLAL
ncbi:MAG: phasin family protein, partial [Burkholderiales bacterium]|nr:phasin family protein [Burkholderiales bacterium]